MYLVGTYCYWFCVAFEVFGAMSKCNRSSEAHTNHNKTDAINELASTPSITITLFKLSKRHYSGVNYSKRDSSLSVQTMLVLFALSLSPPWYFTS